MSTKDTSGTVPGDKPKVMAKFKRRMSKILGRDDSKQTSTAAASTSSAAAGTSPTTPVPAKAVTSAAGAGGGGAATPAAAVPPIPSGKVASTPIRPKSAMTAAEHGKIQEEKARKMFAKYNMTLEAGEWTPPFKSDTPRVEKKVRMRVHRTCHRCQTQFGVDRVCSNCNHNRCKKCPKYPRAKKDVVKGKGATALAEGGYAKRPVTQRTRRICHKCQTTFAPKSSECQNCKHLRCSLCPRDPLKSDTGAGAGDEDPSRRLLTKWTCHECKNVHRDPENSCLRCGHSKCDDCPRDSLKQNAPSTSEEGVRSVEERMRAMNVSPQASAA